MTLDNPKTRQFLLIAVAVVLFIGVAVRYGLFFPGLPGSSAEIEHKEKRVAKYHQLVQRKEVIQQKLIGLGKEVARAENGLLNGKTQALAAVDLQNRLTGIADGSQVTIESQRVLKPPKQGTDEEPLYVQIPVQVTMTLTTRQLQQVLYGIADSPVFLKVTDASIKVKRAEEGTLHATLTVSGLMKDAGGKKEETS